MSREIVLVTAAQEISSDFKQLLENLSRRILAEGVRLSGVRIGGLEQSLQGLAAEGARSVTVIPLSLESGADLFGRTAGVLEVFSAANPGIDLELVTDYSSELVLEDMLWESVLCRVTDKSLLPETGGEIELLSQRIIDTRLSGCAQLSREEKIVARRIIHSTADYSFASTLRFSPGAVAAGIAALRSRRPVICDVNMLKTAMTKIDTEIICLITDPEVIALATQEQCTRAAAAMRLLKDRLDGAIVAVGNAPTAIWQLLKMDVRPALVVGLPVGFVGARESKLELINSGHEFIANTTPKGGSPAAAAALNALALLAQESEV